MKQLIINKKDAFEINLSCIQPKPILVKDSGIFFDKKAICTKSNINKLEVLNFDERNSTTSIESLRNIITKREKQLKKKEELSVKIIDSKTMEDRIKNLPKITDSIRILFRKLKRNILKFSECSKQLQISLKLDSEELTKSI